MNQPRRVEPAITTGRDAARPPPAKRKGRLPLSDPTDVRFVSSDIGRFWRAYEGARSSTDLLGAMRDYLAGGSYGLVEMQRLRIGNESALVDAIAAHPDYYSAIRRTTLQVESAIPAIQASFARFEAMYPDAVFPDVYFVIGRLSAGGTTTDRGLLIGAEMYARSDETPVGELTRWELEQLRGPEMLPGVVAHELIHYQQPESPEPLTLLATAIGEGSADFVASLIATSSPHADLYRYGEQHRDELFREFSEQMDGTDLGDWFYRSETSDGRPADLGYYVGYELCRAYYARAVDPVQALREMFITRDFHEFLRASGYAEKLGAHQ